MSVIDSIYQINDPYLNPRNRAAGTAAGGDTGKVAADTRETDSVADYQVALSPAVEYAKTRELLGLPPTGKLRLDDFKAAMNRDQETVSNSLESIITDLGLPADLSIALSLDDNGDIVTNGFFQGQKALEKALNGDTALVQSFRRLSTNHNIINNIAGTQTGLSDLNLLSDIDEDDSQDSLLQIAARYDAFRSTKNPLETLVRFGDQGTPLTFLYDPKEAGHAAGIA